MKVGFIGLGAMGLPMAKRVIGGGYEVLTMVHRRPEPAEELRAAGARILATAGEIGREADIVITIVPADRELKEIVLGHGGLIHGLSPGKVLIEMTTATPASVQEVETALATVGARVLDAPVSGGTPAAANGALTIMVGGDAALLAECRPLLETMGRNIAHVGGVGQGKVAKMVNQLMAAIHLLSIGEAFSLGVKCGGDPAVLYETIKASSGYSRMMDLRLPGFLLEGSFEPGFKLDLMKKDVQLAVDSAAALAMPLAFGKLAAQVFAAASAEGDGAADFSAAARYLAAQAGAALDGRNK